MKLSIAANYLLSTLTVANVSAQHLREAKHLPDDWIPRDVRNETSLDHHMEDRNVINLDLNLSHSNDNEKKAKANKKGKNKRKNKKGNKKRKNKKGKGSKKAT